MEQTKKALAVKKLQQELKDEKQAEKDRRREITLERRKAAEEKQRLEEDKARVRLSVSPSLSITPRSPPDTFVIIILKMGARKAARLRRKQGRTKKINH
ncbi:hypothetical protein AAF712_000762 [Marasmius tenuissimus]|uniref:rRNA-processing protein n=1 Tax=Marasmius tenuissimus TaxID=585030 RepID=A0ABR3AE66_9AGAR